MLRMLQIPFYDPEKSYEENFQEGPFGAFADGKTIESVQSRTLHKQYDFFGYKVFSPFGIAAGPLINGKFAQAALDKGFDIVTYKTVRSGEHPCHPWPNILSVKVDENLTIEEARSGIIANHNFSQPLSITNSFGVQSFKPEFWQKDMAQVLKNMRSGQVLVGAFQGTKKEGQNTTEYVNDFI